MRLTLRQAEVKAVRFIATAQRILTSKRMWMHLPLGMVNGYVLVKHPALGIGLLLCFLVYELAQDHSANDAGYQDILGHLVGLSVVCVALFILALLEAL